MAKRSVKKGQDKAKPKAPAKATAKAQILADSVKRESVFHFTAQSFSSKLSALLSFVDKNIDNTMNGVLCNMDENDPNHMMVSLVGPETLDEAFRSFFLQLGIPFRNIIYEDDQDSGTEWQSPEKEKTKETDKFSAKTTAKSKDPSGSEKRESVFHFTARSFSFKLTSLLSFVDKNIDNTRGGVLCNMDENDPNYMMVSLVGPETLDEEFRSFFLQLGVPFRNIIYEDDQDSGTEWQNPEKEKTKETDKFSAKIASGSTLWVYKCNRSADAHGDWNEFFKSFGPGEWSDWGGTWATRNASSIRIIREEMSPGDLVLAWQSDIQAAIGLCRVKGFEEIDGEVLILLQSIRHFDIPIKLLNFKKHSPALRAGRAFVQGRMGTIFETTPEEAKEILRLCGV